jgi:hypothetical protein
MTLFFDMDKLEKVSKYSPAKVIGNLKDYYYNKLPSRYDDPKVRQIAGLSFLLNPAPLFNESRSIDLMYVYQYIKLASYRNYGEYKLHGLKSLNLTFFPDIKKELLTLNPLLKVSNKEITFKHE